MEREILEIFFKNCGSVEKAAKIIDIPRETLSAIRNDRIEMKTDYAIQIADYMNKHMNINVHFSEFLSPYKKNKLKHVKFNFNGLPFKLSKMFLSDVKHPIKVDYVPEEFSDLEKSRLIIIDENNQLIANPLTYFLHIQNCVQIISAWRILYLELIERKYEIYHLINTFDVIEIGSIGIAVEKFIGNRQGKRTDLFRSKKQRAEYERRLKLDEVTGRTDQFIADLLGLTRTQYRQLKKIILHGSCELIEMVRAKKISISAAAESCVKSLD